MKRQRVFFLIPFVLVVCSLTFWLSCGDGGNDGVAVSFSGNWEGATIDEQQPEDVTTFYLKLDVKGTDITGSLKRNSSGSSQTGEITGSQGGEEASFSATLSDEEIVVFSCQWAQEVNGFGCSWGSSSGKSGRVVFSPTDYDITAPPSPIIFNEYKLEKKGGSGTPVIFIHGMYDNAQMWEGMLNKLNEKGFYSKHEVWTYQYDWTKHILDNGLDLLQRLNTQGIKSPIIVAHSMGGLVSRAYITHGGDVTKLVTLGTPHTGTQLASLSWLVSWLNTTGVADMAPFSPFMILLNDHPRDISYRSKYYTFAGRMIGNWVTERKCVSGSTEICWDEPECSLVKTCKTISANMCWNEPECHFEQRCKDICGNVPVCGWERVCVWGVCTDVPTCWTERKCEHICWNELVCGTVTKCTNVTKEVCWDEPDCRLAHKCKTISGEVCWDEKKLVWDAEYHDLTKQVWPFLRLITNNKESDGLVPEDSALLSGTNTQTVKMSRDHTDLVNPDKAPNVLDFIIGL